jgi:hypothetical protein
MISLIFCGTFIIVIILYFFINIFLVIGRGGEQISRIQAETGCKVQVAPDSAGAKDRPCYLQGTKESIE